MGISPLNIHGGLPNVTYLNYLQSIPLFNKFYLQWIPRTNFKPTNIWQAGVRITNGDGLISGCIHLKHPDLSVGLTFIERNRSLFESIFSGFSTIGPDFNRYKSFKGTLPGSNIDCWMYRCN